MPLGSGDNLRPIETIKVTSSLNLLHIIQKRRGITTKCPAQISMLLLCSSPEIVHRPSWCHIVKLTSSLQTTPNTGLGIGIEWEHHHFHVLNGTSFHCLTFFIIYNHRRLRPWAANKPTNTNHYCIIQLTAHYAKRGLNKWASKNDLHSPISN